MSQLAVVRESPGFPKNSHKDSVLRFIRSNAAEPLSAVEILSWGIKNFSTKIALSCSFGAPEGLILLDMLHRIDPASRVFVLDTGRLPQATYDLIDLVRDRYDKQVEVVFPAADAVQSLVSDHGLNLFYENIEKRQLCCRVRKTEPLNRHLVSLDAWVTGLRRDQNATRADTPKVEIDRVHQDIINLNPIADWSHEQVLDYVATHQVPTNRLHRAGYPSVGCDPCSRAISAGDDPRAGRWWWEDDDTKECGIHVEEKGSGI
ncbi:MAG: phosphoadenylyl-sulfate reductase [Myxococcota bacterium]